MQDNIKALNFNSILDVIERCKEIYDIQIENLGESENNIIDDPIIDYLLEVSFIEPNPAHDPDDSKNHEPKYLPTLLVIDEAQNHFGEGTKADPLIRWWISYHRHLFMDVFLIAQSYDKIHNANRKDIEYYLDAVEAGRTILGGRGRYFIYNHYVKTPYFKTNLAKKVRIKKRKEIFECYQSGDKVRTKSVVLPLIIFAVLGIALVVGIIMYLKSSFGSSDTNDTESVSIESPAQASSKIIHPTRSSKIITTTNYDRKRYIGLTCIGTDCTNSTLHIKVQLDHLKDLLKNTDSKFISSSRLGNDLTNLYLLVSSDFIELFKERTNEKSNQGGFSLLH
jgi:zona occludens toxin